MTAYILLSEGYETLHKCKKRLNTTKEEITLKTLSNTKSSVGKKQARFAVSALESYLVLLKW